jgi:hypothetical protein
MFSRRLRPEKLNPVIHFPTIGHKIERLVIAKKQPTDRVAREADYSITSVDSG